MQHALRYVWSIPSARAEQKRIILSLNIPIRDIMTDRATFRKTVFRVYCVKAQKEENDPSCMTSSSAMAV